MFGASPLTGYCKRQRPARSQVSLLSVDWLCLGLKGEYGRTWLRDSHRSLVPSRFGLNPLRRNPAQSIEEDDSTAFTLKYLVVK